MANLTRVLVVGGGGGGDSFDRSFEGLSVSRTGTGTIEVAPGLARSDDGTIDILLAAATPATLDTIGVNGLDIGVKAQDTIYAVWIIEGPSIGVLLSTSFTDPVMPPGFTAKRRVGSIKTKIASTSIINFHEVWHGRTRRYWMDSDETEGLVLDASSGVGWLGIDLSSKVPPTSDNVIIRVVVEIGTGVAGDATTQKVYFRPDTFNAASVSMWGASSGIVGGEFTAMMEMACPGRMIDYRNPDANAITSVYVAGFDDEM